MEVLNFTEGLRIGQSLILPEALEHQVVACVKRVNDRHVPSRHEASRVVKALEQMIPAKYFPSSFYVHSGKSYKKHRYPACRIVHNSTGCFPQGYTFYIRFFVLKSFRASECQIFLHGQLLTPHPRWVIDGFQWVIDGLSTGWITGSIPFRLLPTRLAQTLTSSRLAFRRLHTAALSIRLGPAGGEPRN